MEAKTRNGETIDAVAWAQCQLCEWCDAFATWSDASIAGERHHTEAHTTALPAVLVNRPVAEHYAGMLARECATLGWGCSWENTGGGVYCLEVRRGADDARVSVGPFGASGATEWIDDGYGEVAVVPMRLEGIYWMPVDEDEKTHTLIRSRRDVIARIREVFAR